MSRPPPERAAPARKPRPEPPARPARKTDSHEWAGVDFRAHPELYRIGRGEQGVLTAEPYKAELLPHWRFRTPEVALASSQALYERFLSYKQAGDFVGMDMARKFLQMGFTRARRYANHRSGRKWSPGKGAVLAREEDPVKAAAARVFYEAYRKARDDADYQRLARQHREAYG